MTREVPRDAASEIVIERRPAPSLAEFEHTYLRASQPAIFTDVVPTWKAWGRWSSDYFRESWGRHQTHVVLTHGRDMQYEAMKGFQYREMRMVDALDHIDRGGQEGVYVTVPLDRYLDGLLAEVEVPAYCRGRPGFRPHLWISPADIGAPLHRDFSENLIGQISGVKQYVLYPPEESHRLYAFQRCLAVPGFSPVNAEAPDPVRFPRCVDARRVVVTLRAGEMLFLPSRWWHQVRSIEASLNVNFWWAAGVYGKVVRVAQRLRLGASV